ncbi:GNAT family N-acetyltransferase [Jannaschia sp. R86511]|uniref:GNAT family N-acetyltransferase n=1 Tax=Jannaschia sp. R86511 TaxID=3093853 RepID=UPI0036D286F7
MSAAVVRTGAVASGPRGPVLAPRPMRWWDLDAVMAVEQPSFGPDAWTREGFLSELAERGSRTYLVLPRDAAGAGGAVPGPLLGYVGVAAHGPDADVQTLAVDPGRRGGGLGRCLVDLARAAAAAAGARRLGLEVREDNVAAQALYRSAGFRPQGRRPGYYAPTEPGGPRTTAVLMQADLGPADLGEPGQADR